MNIKAPLTNINEVKPLCDAGADEFFCGIEPEGWRKEYENFSINQRTGNANFSKLNDLEKAVRAAHQCKARVHVTVNAFFYLEKQYEAVKRIIKDVINAGADGVIFADPALLHFADKKVLAKKDVIAGCDTTVFNHQSAALYKDLGATRIVFPRAMTIQEMEETARQDCSLEYEVFIMHDLCFFVDGFCAYCKEASGTIKNESEKEEKVSFFTAARVPRRGYGGGCKTGFKQQRVYFQGKKKTETDKAFTFWGSDGVQGCGACAIYNLKKTGITHLKVLDRNLPSDEKVKATRFIKRSLDILKDDRISRSEYMARCRDLFHETFKFKCVPQNHCYYPSVFMGRV